MVLSLHSQLAIDHFKFIFQREVYIMERILVAYWSGTGHTEAMMEAIAAGIKEADGEVDIMGPGDYDVEKAAAYQKILLGCPAMGDEQLEEDDFEPFFSALESKLAGKKIGLFGSYDWNDGQWIVDWGYRASNKNGQLFDDGLAIKASSDVDVQQTCKDWGKKFAAF